MFLPYIIVLFGVFAGSTSVIFLKLSQTDPVLLSAYRLLVAGIVLLPWFFRARGKNPGAFVLKDLRRIVWPAFFLGIHFITWMIGARFTPAANSTLIVMMVPIVMPFLMWFLLRELINRREILGTLLSIFGVVLLGAADYRFNPQYALGDALSFGSMVLLALYMALGRVNRDFASVYLYIVPVFLLGGLICLVFAAAGIAAGLVKPYPIGANPWEEIAYILCLGLVPTVFGHGIINYALRILRGQVVAIFNLGQFIFAGLLGAKILHEIPTPEFYIASLLTVAGAVIVIRATPARLIS